MTKEEKTAYIITGHTGEIGKALASLIIGQGNKVIGISRGILEDADGISNEMQISQFQCDFSQTGNRVLNEDQLVTISKLLNGYDNVIYIMNAGQNSDPGRSTTEILSDVLKLIKVNALSQIRLLNELLMYNPNVINKCVFIGSYLSYLKPQNSSLGYVLSKNLLHELTFLYNGQNESTMEMQTIVLGGVDTEMNRNNVVNKNFYQKWASDFFKMSPEKAAKSIILATETTNPIKFIPLLPAIHLSILHYTRRLLQVQLYIFRK
jgi:short-subunit dehydrogenase